MENNYLHLEPEHNCSICLDVINDNIVCLHKCKHQFHNTCISMWFEKNNTCPLCRETILDLYRCKFKKQGFFGSTYQSMVLELKENKIVFYPIQKIKKRLTQNFTFSNINNPENRRYENQEENNNLNLLEEWKNKNFILDLKSNESIGDLKFQILYSDISKVSSQFKYIRFHHLKIKKDIKNAMRTKNSKCKLSLKFENIRISKNFFETLKKRHQYFRETNY